MSTNSPITIREHERFMQRCIELARIAKNRGNTPVGSVVVKGGDIIGEGMEDAPTGLNLTGHAEIIACQEAAQYLQSKVLRDTILYTTAEPCFMCSYVIRQCVVSMVVYGEETPTVGGITSTMPILIDESLSDWKPTPRTLAGILREDCRNLKA